MNNSPVHVHVGWLSSGTAGVGVLVPSLDVMLIYAISVKQAWFYERKITKDYLPFKYLCNSILSNRNSPGD